MTMEPNQYLYEAIRLVQGERARDYGDAPTNFKNIARGWSVLLGTEVKPDQVALCLSWLKMARLASPTISDEAAADCVVDGAGYLAIAGSLGLTSEYPREV